MYFQEFLHIYVREQIIIREYAKKNKLLEGSNKT